LIWLIHKFNLSTGRRVRVDRLKEKSALTNPKLTKDNLSTFRPSSAILGKKLLSIWLRRIGQKPFIQNIFSSVGGSCIVVQTWPQEFEKSLVFEKVVEKSSSLSFVDKILCNMLFPFCCYIACCFSVYHISTKVSYMGILKLLTLITGQRKPPLRL
jgi:hypothetical protein